MLFFLFISTFVTIPCVLGAIPAKNYTDSRGVEIGIKALTRDQIAAVTACVHNDFYNQLDITDVGLNALSCVTNELGSGQMTQLALILPGLETCFVFSGTLTAIVLTKAAGVFYPEFSTFYDKMMVKFNGMKAAGRKKDDVLNEGYKMVNQRYKRPLINELCLKLAKTMTKNQFNCLMTNGKPIMDVTTYDCARYVKADLLG